MKLLGVLQLPTGRDASPSQVSPPPPPAVWRRYPFYTPGLRETKWSKVPCQRKQRDRRGFKCPSPKFFIFLSETTPYQNNFRQKILRFEPKTIFFEIF